MYVSSGITYMIFVPFCVVVYFLTVIIFVHVIKQVYTNVCFK
jgi:hypothetical protein